MPDDLGHQTPHHDALGRVPAPRQRYTRQTPETPAIVTAALAVAASGFPVFPCDADKKALVKNWGKVATRDPATIKQLFSKPAAKLIGVPTGKLTGIDGLDLDPKNGSDPWRQKNIDRLTETLIHGTMNSGEHWIYAHVEGVRNQQDGKTIHPGVDVRGEGGYLIWPPSPGYSVIHDAPIAPWPDWLLPFVVKQDKPPPPRPETGPTIKTDQLEFRYRRWIDKLLANVRTAAEGSKHDVLLKQATALRGVIAKVGMTEEEVASLVEQALPDTVKDWKKARRTVWDGLRYGRERPTIELEDRPYHRGNGHHPPSDGPSPDVNAPSQDNKKAEEKSSTPEPETPEPPNDPAEAVLREFNGRYFVVNENGRAVIYSPRHDPILNRRFFDRLAFADFEKLYANVTVRIGKDRINAAKWWIRHPQRRQFIGGIVFDPASRNGNPDVLNLWEGFAVTPRAGSWSKLHDHIRDVICASDPVTFTYLLDWMADLVQNPARQGEVAVVLRGLEGCGKGTLAKALKHLLGQHGLAISNARHLTGNFNSHLRDVVFLFADEAFFAGDKQHVGVLKALITEPYLTIEGKYQNAVQMPNFLHVMMASNEDWVVPASLNSRRWLVLDVPDTRIGDHPYFAAIHQELERGGHEAMLHDLLNRDLTKSNLRAVPVTEALQTQRKRSLDTITAWWLDCLHRGYVFRSKLGLEDHWQQWHIFLPTEVLFASYEQYCREHRERHPQTRELFGRWITSMGANPGRMRNQAIGEHIMDAFSDGRSSRVAELIKHPFPYGYSIGELGEARLMFTSRSGLEIEWDA